LNFTPSRSSTKLRNAFLSAIVFIALIPVCEINKSGDPWFVAKDLCDVLEITDNRVALRRLDDDEKGEYTIPTPGGMQKVSIVNESGMYSLVLTSRKPEAKVSQKWVNTRTALTAPKL